MSTPARFITGIALAASGYALAYYGINVLRWAHSEATADPVPLSHLFGFPEDWLGTPAPFMPPFRFGITIPGAVTDARGLLGGTPETGGYVPFSGVAAGSSGGNVLGEASDGATGAASGWVPRTPTPAGPVPAPSGGGRSFGVSGAGTKPSYGLGPAQGSIRT